MQTFPQFAEFNQADQNFPNNQAGTSDLFSISLSPKIIFLRPRTRFLS